MRFPVTIRPLLLVAIFPGILAFTAMATTYYVDVNSANPTPPYTSWATASTDIQSAIDVSTNGDLVLVNPGVYATGGEAVNGYELTNRVVIDQSVTVESVNGPAATMIEGNQDSNPNNDVRCISLVAGANLIGFTLTNGATMQSVQTNYDDNGGRSLVPIHERLSFELRNHRQYVLWRRRRSLRWHA